MTKQQTEQQKKKSRKNSDPSLSSSSDSIIKTGTKRKNTLTSVEEQSDEEADDDAPAKIQHGRTKTMDMTNNGKQKKSPEQSRQKEAANKRREKESSKKETNKANLAKKSSNQTALSSTNQSKAEEDLAGDELADFADTENEALLEIMYQGCKDREGEMEYSEIDLLLAEKLETLADENVIRENWMSLGKKRGPPIPEIITDSPDTLRKFMDKE